MIRSHPSSDGSSVLKSSDRPFGSCFCLFFSGLRAVCSGPDMIAIRDRADRRLQVMKLGNMALQDFRLGWCFGAKKMVGNGRCGHVEHDRTYTRSNVKTELQL